MHRVIIWGTGFVGKAVIKSLVSHPAYEIVAVLVNDPDKEGRDAGEIAGIDPIGVRATRDVEATLDSDRTHWVAAGSS